MDSSTKKRMRPAVMVSALIPERTCTAIEQFALGTNVSRSAAVRLAIDELLERRKSADPIPSVRKIEV